MGIGTKVAAVAAGVGAAVAMGGAAHAAPTPATYPVWWSTGYSGLFSLIEFWDGSAQGIQYLSRVSQLAGITTNPSNGKIVWEEVQNQSSTVRTETPNVGNTMVLAGTAAVSAGDPAVDLATGRVWYVAINKADDSWSIRSVAADGTGDRLEVRQPSANSRIQSIALDPVGRRVYWSGGPNADDILSAPMGGGAITVVAPGVAAAGVAIDAVCKRVIWGTGSVGLVRSSNFLGGDRTTLYDNKGVVTDFVAADSATGRLWWTTYQRGSRVDSVMSLRQGTTLGGPPATLFSKDIGNAYVTGLGAGLGQGYTGTCPGGTVDPSGGGGGGGGTGGGGSAVPDHQRPGVGTIDIVGKVTRTRLSGTRMRINVTARYLSSGRYSFYLVRSTGRRQPMLAGTRLGSRTLTKSISAWVVRSARSGSQVRMSFVVPSRQARDLMLRSVATTSAGTAGETNDIGVRSR